MEANLQRKLTNLIADAENETPLGRGWKGLYERELLIAELTWKAREPEIEEARKAERKEVVDWVKANQFRAVIYHRDIDEYQDTRAWCFKDDSWQAQLKSWGIEQKEGK